MSKFLNIFLCAALMISLGVLAAVWLHPVLYAPPEVPEPTLPPSQDVQIMDCYDALVNDAVAQAYDASLEVKKIYSIPLDATAAPVPDQSCFGQTPDPSSLQWLLDDAAELLDGQDTLFRTDVEIYPGSQVYYYLDDSIFAVVWKQVFDNFVYTISEVKIAHPSQFRRHIAGNSYGCLYGMNFPSKMAEEVNAVVASSADYYLGRQYGIRVYNGEVCEVERGDAVDTCYIDRHGDLHFTYAGEILDEAAAKEFVAEHDIWFSISFGPVLIDNGERCEPDYYPLGETNDHYARAAFGQRDKLHYITVTANAEGRCWDYQDIHTLAENLMSFGCDKFYTLDGGQTGTIIINNQRINRVEFDSQRYVSDIIYFGTAIPNGLSEASE